MKTFIKTMVMTIMTLFNVQAFGQSENVAVVSADKMNVFYIGIDNPISIAVPGITSDKLIVSNNNGTITGSNGKYIVKVDNVMETIIEVSAEIKPGVTKKCGSSIFRVKRIPNPTACLGNNCNGVLHISKDELLKDPTVNVSLILPFDLKFEVISFTVTVNLNGEIKNVSLIGNKFSQEIIDLVAKIDIGNKIFIEDIKVKGPDGASRYLSPIVINITEKE